MTEKKAKDLKKKDIITLTRQYRIINIKHYDTCSQVKIEPIYGDQSLLDHHRQFLVDSTNST